MAQEVKLMGATYSDVPSVMLPDSTNVLHKFTDTSDSTLTRADQLPVGVTAYDKTGALLTGTAPDTSHIVADYRLSETALGSDGSVDLSEAIGALTTYSNEVTGASDTTLSAAVGSLADGYGGGGVDWITYHSDTTVIRTGVQGQPTIPVIPGALVIIRCPDEQSGGYANIYASFSSDGTRYDYGIIRSGKFTNNNRNYAVNAGATVVTPKWQIFSAWMADHTITGVPVYIVN